jgi:hypothetical protein
MSNGNDTASYQDCDRDTQWVARARAIPDPLGSRSDPLSSEDIDAQIRWFFENALERKPPRP